MSQKTLKIFIASILTVMMTGGFFVSLNSNALAALGINKQINFQGKVVNTDGTNVVNGNYNFIFSIYDVDTAGVAIWTENKTITVTDGIFQTNLGSSTAFPGSVDFNSDNIYLGINFNANGEMTPRIRFTATPYAFNTDSLDGGDWSIPGAIGSTTPNSGIFTSLGVVEAGGSPIFHTFFQGGDQVADITYTLPVLAANGILRNSGGVLSWDTLSYVANPMTAVGDIIYGGASGTPTRLPGSAGFMTSTGAAAPVWTAATTDYFTQYALLAGRAGGQTLRGGVNADNVMTIQGNIATGNTATSSNIVFRVGDSGGTTALSLLNNGNADFNHNQAVNFRVENANGSVVTPICDAANQGRMYYDTNARSAFVCIETSPSVYGWFDYTTTSVQSNKVVTVGTSGDYATIAAGAGYLSTLGGGIILLTPETHNVTSSVDLSNMSLIGANTGDTRINVTGAGTMRVKETQFKSMTIYVDAGISATSAIDMKYSAATTSSVIFEWVDFIINGSKVLVNSSEAISPTVRTRFISTSTTSGTQKIFLPIASANLNIASTHFVESQGGNGTLDIEDWNVKISGSSNIKTSGTIETIPDSTIFVYPGMNLQGAIDSISSGGVITLLPGTHNISNTLLIDKDNIKIEGYGDASIIRAAGFVGGTDTTAGIQIGSADGITPNNNIVLDSFKLEVSNSSGSDIHGIRMAGGSDNQILNLSVAKVGGASGTAAGARVGIQLLDGTAQKLTRPVVKGCSISGDSSLGAYFTDGIHVTGGASYGAGSGIWTNGQGIEGALVDGNYVDYVRETVAVFIGVNNSSLFNNRFSRMGAGGGGAFGIFFGNSANVNMTSNVVSTSLSTTSYALVIDGINSGSLKQITDSVFTANVIDGVANGGVGFAYGLNIGATANTAFHRNVFTNNIINGASNATTTAITVIGNADDNNFSNNVLNGINNPWDTGINIVSATAERNFIGKNAFINTTVNITDVGTATQMGAVQHNATVNPVASNDSTQGYAVGAIWVNTATQNIYMATSVAIGAAVWEQIDAVGGGESTLQGAYDADVDGGNVNIVMTATDGSVVMQNAAGTQFQVTMAPTIAAITDLANIINTGAGQGTTAVGADGLQIDFANGGALAMDNAGMRVNVVSNNNVAGTTLEGIAVGNISGQVNATETAIQIGTGWDRGLVIASGGEIITGGALAIDNTSGITSNQATLNINASGTVNIQDILNADSITVDTGGVSIAAGQAYTGAGAVDISSGAGTGLTINSGTTGAISIGSDASAETINIGTGTAAKTIVLGSTNTTSTTTIQAGTGGISLQVAGAATSGNVQIGAGGAGSATPDILALDVKNNIGDPAGVEGAMYYNTADNKFRCYQGTAWTDCIADNVSVNGVAANNANFSDTTVATPNGGVNVKWQKDTVNPDNISAYFDFGNYEQAFKKKPIMFSDFVNGPTATYNMPFLGGAISSGTIAAPLVGTVNGDHPGVVRLRSSTTANGGYRLQAYNGAIRLKGGEVFEGILQHTNIATTTIRMGFNDNTTRADAVDGCYFEVATTGIARGKCANNSVRTQTTGSYVISLNTWYTYRITLNAAATLATFEIFNSAGTSLFTTNNTVATNIPTVAGRETNVGIVATESTTTATNMVHVDYMGFNLGTTNALAR